MATPTVGRLCYGTYWKISDEPEAAAALTEALDPADEGLEVGDLLDLLAQRFDAQMVYQDGIYTVFFGEVITDLSTETNAFDEMSLVRMLDLQRGVLHDEHKHHVKKLIEDIPYNLRDFFSRPQFFVAWGTT